MADYPEFTLRQDQNGFRPVFPLGNALGRCPYNCRFCGVKASGKVSPDEAKRRFDELRAAYAQAIAGLYHPIIYNQGNVTNPREFARPLLDYILDCFRADDRVVYVSLNSRECEATDEVLEHLAGKELPYPIHFILGLESLSSRARGVFGKDTRGELERFVQRLKPYNEQRGKQVTLKGYVFGLDVNLVFLPALYGVSDSSTPEGVAEVTAGLRRDLELVLTKSDSAVPLEINIHPYHRVEALPYDDADLDLLMAAIPELQAVIDDHNAGHQGRKSHLFIGIEGLGYESAGQRRQVQKWKTVIDRFNVAGILDRGLCYR